jgi:hypothetical protein
VSGDLLLLAETRCTHYHRSSNSASMTILFSLLTFFKRFIQRYAVNMPVDCTNDGADRFTKKQTAQHMF